MTSAMQVTQYMKSQIDVWGEMQVQKLLYYSQSWSLVWRGRPLFDEPIEAWRMGPVVRSVRHITSEAAPNAEAISGDERAVVDAVLAHYGRRNGAELGALTHSEAPWRDVWGGRSDDDSCNEEITRDAMRRYYTTQALVGEGPARPQETERTSIGVHVAMQRAEKQAARWREALDLLAQ